MVLQACDYDLGSRLPPGFQLSEIRRERPVMQGQVSRMRCGNAESRSWGCGLNGKQLFCKQSHVGSNPIISTGTKIAGSTPAPYVKVRVSVSRQHACVIRCEEDGNLLRSDRRETGFDSQVPDEGKDSG